MLTIGKQNTGKKYNEARLELFALSTDTPFPTDDVDGIKILNGSSLTEIDTGVKHLFDEENSTWYQQP
jgi:hypothetical protein